MKASVIASVFGFALAASATLKARQGPLVGRAGGYCELHVEIVESLGGPPGPPGPPPPGWSLFPNNWSPAPVGPPPVGAPPPPPPPPPAPVAPAPVVAQSSPATPPGNFAGLAGCSASGSTVPVSIANEYSSPSFATSNTSCAGSLGGTTFGGLPQYPNIAAFCGAGYFQSQYCGSCFTLTYNGNTVKVLAVDNKASNGFLLPSAVCDQLAGGAGVCQQMGTVNAVFNGPVAC